MIPEDQVTCSGVYSEYRDGVPVHWRVMFHPTDAGRRESARPRSKNDCTVRAVALAFDMSFDAAYDLLSVNGREPHRGFNFKAFTKTQPRLKWLPFQAVKGESRMNPAKFCQQFKTGRYILRTAKHVFTVVDGIVLDTHSPSPARCVYGAWEVLP